MCACSGKGDPPSVTANDRNQSNQINQSNQSGFKLKHQARVCLVHVISQLVFAVNVILSFT